MEETDVQLEVNTLLHKPKLLSTITTSTVSDDLDDRQSLKPLRQLPANHGFDVTAIRAFYKPENQQTELSETTRSLVVKGSEIGDLPTEYEICGLYHDELPVIGNYVHPSVTPGFRYRVRLLGKRSRVIYDNRGTFLLSLGRGYGKRLTFEGETLNNNDNYFYSDSSQHGFGLTLVAIREGDTFLVCHDEGAAIGEGIVRGVSVQKETHSRVDTDRNIVKHVGVSFSCEVKYGPEKHGLMPLCSLETLQLNGTALIIKSKDSRKAFTKTITDIVLPNYGSCIFKFSSK